MRQSISNYEKLSFSTVAEQSFPNNSFSTFLLFFLLSSQYFNSGGVSSPELSCDIFVSFTSPAF